MSQFVKKTLLLVEDEALLAMHEKMQLEQYGYAVRTVTTGEKAVEAVQTSTDIDLILMDINLGNGIDGTQAAEIILNERDIPIVFLSSHTDPEVVEKTEKITSYGYVVKSSSITVLDASIKMAFKLASADRQLKAELAKRKRSEQELIDQKQYFETILETISDGLWVATPDGKITNVNIAYCWMSGYSKDELTSMEINDLEVIENPEETAERVERIMENGSEVFETKHRGEDGSIFDVEVSSSRLDDADGVFLVSFCRDITERKRLERELEESSKRYQVLVDRSPSIIYLFGTKSGGIFWSEATRRILGIDPQDVVRDSFLWNRSIHPDDKETVDAAIAGALTGNPFDIEYRIQASDDRWVWLRDRLIDRSEERGEVIIQGHAEDITERKQAAEAQRESLRRLEFALQAGNLGIWDWNPQDGSVAYSDLWAEMLEYRPDEVEPTVEFFEKHVHPDDRAAVLDRLTGHVEGRLPVYESEHRFRTKSGRWLWVHDVGKTVEWDHGGHPVRVTGLITDITAYKEAEEEIGKQLSEKETLLREVHHRVKNNMATIESFVSLQSGSATSPEVRSALQDVISRVQSMRVLYDKLLQSADLHEVSMKSYAEDLINSLLAVFDPEHIVTTETHITDFEIRAKQGFSLGIIINELLTNVFKYAFESMDSGTVAISIDKEASTVTLTIQDNGVGFDERALKNESPGFGLTVVRMLVEETGGTYTISNDHGAKSVVRFEL